MPVLYWLVVSTHLKNISQIGSFPQVGVKIKNNWNHHLVYFWTYVSLLLFPSQGGNPFFTGYFFSEKCSTIKNIPTKLVLQQHKTCLKFAAFFDGFPPWPPNVFSSFHPHPPPRKSSHLVTPEVATFLIDLGNLFGGGNGQFFLVSWPKNNGI